MKGKVSNEISQTSFLFSEVANFFQKVITEKYFCLTRETKLGLV